MNSPRINSQNKLLEKIGKLLRTEDDAEIILERLRQDCKCGRGTAMILIKFYVQTCYGCPVDAVNALRAFSMDNTDILDILHNKFNLEGDSVEDCLEDYRQFKLTRNAGVAPQYV